MAVLAVVAGFGLAAVLSHVTARRLRPEGFSQLRPALVQLRQTTLPASRR
jgi:hypothetical protein